MDENDQRLLAGFQQEIDRQFTRHHHNLLVVVIGWKWAAELVLAVRASENRLTLVSTLDTTILGHSAYFEKLSAIAARAREYLAQKLIG